MRLIVVQAAIRLAAARVHFCYLIAKIVWGLAKEFPLWHQVHLFGNTATALRSLDWSDHVDGDASHVQGNLGWFFLWNIWRKLGRHRQSLQFARFLISQFLMSSLCQSGHLFSTPSRLDRLRSLLIRVVVFWLKTSFFDTKYKVSLIMVCATAHFSHFQIWRNHRLVRHLHFMVHVGKRICFVLNFH